MLHVYWLVCRCLVKPSGKPGIDFNPWRESVTQYMRLASLSQLMLSSSLISALRAQWLPYLGELAYLELILLIQLAYKWHPQNNHAMVIFNPCSRNESLTALA